jgi:hypothetical protein
MVSFVLVEVPVAGYNVPAKLGSPTRSQFCNQKYKNYTPAAKHHVEASPGTQSVKSHVARCYSDTRLLIHTSTVDC